jgi:hypothetical protein
MTIASALPAHHSPLLLVSQVPLNMTDTEAGALAGPAATDYQVY